MNVTFTALLSIPLILAIVSFIYLTGDKPAPGQVLGNAFAGMILSWIVWATTAILYLLWRGA